MLEDEISGEKVYTFSKRKNRDGMNNAAITAGQKNKENKTGVQSSETESENKLMCVKTPKHLRKRVKSRILHIVADKDDLESDESDYTPSDEIASESDSDSDEDSEPKITIEPHISRPVGEIKPSANRHGKIKRSTHHDEFVPKSEDFFRAHNHGVKVNTSEHTLELLKTSRLPLQKVFSLLAQIKTSSEHEKSMNENLEEYRAQFRKWLYILNEGYNLLVYGLGSKRQLLQMFQNMFLTEHPVLVVNGFFPSLSLKQILDTITQDVIKANTTPENLNEQIDFIENEFAQIPSMHLFLIVHNLDGPMLHNSNTQSVFARLSKIKNIHLLASVDHINAPLLWDHTKLSNYNFSWWDCTTLLPYRDETAFEDSLLVQNSSGFALSSLRSVFSSLTSNARGIYLLIIAHQLKNKSSSNYQGMPIKDLYWSCREKFLVSSDTALRAQLTEFLDHKLIKSKRSVDGIELLTIPIDDILLKNFMEEQNNL